jgi:hypothetical protein
VPHLELADSLEPEDSQEALKEVKAMEVKHLVHKLTKLIDQLMFYFFNILKFAQHYNLSFITSIFFIVKFIRIGTGL